jgi:hypothetical protein
MDNQFREPKRLNFERGQTLVFVVLMIFALVAMLALVLDGGMAYAQRRSAQNAADAGALAGANEYCSTGIETLAVDKALEYAVGWNNADVDTTAIVIDGEVVVDAVVKYPPFFASIFGYSEMEVAATASAGCFQPCRAADIIPIVFACGPPAGEEFEEGHEDCEFEYGTETEAGPIYVVAESDDIDCEYGDDVCDLGVGFGGAFNGGLKSWLNLDGGGADAAEIIEWLNGINVPEIELVTWLSEGRGTSTSVYHELKTKEGEIFVLPVFDARCPQGDPRVHCPDKYVTGDNVVLGNLPQMFRISDFVIFKLTCVVRNSGDSCPGKNALVAANPHWTNGFINSLKTIEGYFIEGTHENVSGRCGDSPYQGVYTIYLSR